VGRRYLHVPNIDAGSSAPVPQLRGDRERLGLELTVANPTRASGTSGAPSPAILHPFNFNATRAFDRSVKAQIGDIIEIPTSNGVAYAQYIRRVPERGALLAVMDGLDVTPATDLTEVVDRPLAFYVLFPLQAALTRDIVRRVGTIGVPYRFTRHPVLRSRGRVEPDGTVRDWWLWDGERRWRVEALDDAQRDLSLAEIVNDTLLVERLETGWRPRHAH
jgi:hypothetical protein